MEGNNRAQTSIGVSDALTLSPTLVITGQAGYTRWTQEGTHPSFDQTTLGFPKSLTSQAGNWVFREPIQLPLHEPVPALVLRL